MVTKFLGDKKAQLQALLILSTLLLLAGFFMPMMTITQFFFFDHSFSIVAAIGQLLQQGQLFLFTLIVLFTIIIPLAKITLLFALLQPQTIARQQQKKLLDLMHNYGRWAMLDVMVVAVLIVSVKLGMVASIQIHAGLYVFATAVLLIMFITQQVVKQLSP